MEKYIPDMYQKSIYTVNYQKLIDNGVKCVLFDLDNTLVPYHIKHGNDEIKELFNSLREKGLKVIIFSNSPSKRVNVFKEELAVDCLPNAAKPSKIGFEKIMNKYKYNITELAIVGDQMMTDILGGNKVGITTVLVTPVSPKDPYWTKPGRFRERRIMNKLRNHDLFSKGRYYD